MVDDLGGPNPTQLSMKAQQILSAYQAYRQGATQAPSQPRPPSTPSYTSSNPPSTGEPIQISSATLARVNALRAEQDLPPLQEVSNVQVVRGTMPREPQQSVPQPQRITTSYKPLATRQPIIQVSQNQLQNINLARSSQGLAPLSNYQIVKGTQSLPVSQGGEAVSFLKFPFMGQKAGSTAQVQSTTILDPLQFLGLGGAASLAIKGGEFFAGLIRGEAKTIIKEGSKDIGLVVKPTEDYVKAALFEKQAARLPPPGSIKPTPPPKVPSFPSGGGTPYKETAINLGMGLGKVVSKEGGGGLVTDITKPPTGPSTSEVDKYMQSRLRQFEDIAKAKGYVITPTEKGIKAVPKESLKETSAGKGLVQLVKEKPPEVKAVQKPTIVKPTQAELLTKQYEEQIQKLRTKQKFKIDEQTGQMVSEETALKTKTKQQLEFMFVRPTPTKTKTVFVRPQTTKQRRTGIVPLIPITTQPQKTRQRITPIVPPFVPTMTKPTTLIPPPTKPQPPKIPTRTPTPETPEPPKRPPFGGLVGSNTLPGALGKVGKRGARKGYIGNVPITNIVGVYKRSEITYGSTAERLASRGTKQTTSKFGSLSTKKGKRKL